jgi:uncharacterized protein (DUF1330 family)
VASHCHKRAAGERGHSIVHCRAGQPEHAQCLAAHTAAALEQPLGSLEHFQTDWRLSMPAYLINHLRQPGVLQVEVLNYLERVQATLAPFDGKFIVQSGELEVLEGAWAGSVIVLSFPDMKGGQAWYRSAAYQEILCLRTDHVVGDVILVDGVGPDHTPGKFAQKLRDALAVGAIDS